MLVLDVALCTTLYDFSGRKEAKSSARLYDPRQQRYKGSRGGDESLMIHELAHKRPSGDAIPNILTEINDMAF